MPGFVSQGDDKQSALENIRETIELVLEVSAVGFSWKTEPEGTDKSHGDTLARIADEIKEVLKGKEQNGLNYAGIFLEQVEIAVKALP